MPLVLIVDDDGAVRRNLGRAVQGEGFDAIEASRGEEAIALAKANRFDAAIVDFRLPGIDGLETMIEIQRFHRALPVILISGYGTIPVAVQAMRLGAVDFLQKPFRSFELLARLGWALRIPAKSETGSRYVSRAAAIVRERFSQSGLNIATIASELGISSDYLGRLFLRLTRQSLLDYLHETRVNEAIRLLSIGTTLIKEVVDRCGYHSHAELGLHFRQLKGCSPTDWLRRPGINREKAAIASTQSAVT
jgi:YesN/AraC family two-component response regulator